MDKLAENGLASLEFWLSFTTTLVLVGSPWIVYALWRGRDVDELLFGEYGATDQGKPENAGPSEVDGTPASGKRSSTMDEKTTHSAVTATTGKRDSKGGPGHGKKRKKQKQGSSKPASMGNEHLSDHHDSDEASCGEAEAAKFTAPQGCKIVPNPMHLLRAAEYNRFKASEGREALTAYDKQLAARDQQAIFCNPVDCAGDKALEIAHAAMMTAWQARDPEQRKELAHDALSISPHCSGAYILLAEEEASNVADALELFTKGAEAGERHLRRLNSQYLTHHQADFWMKPETRPYVYARRRMGMCLAKLGRYEQAVKVFSDLLANYPSVTCSHLNVQANMIDALLSMRQYDEAQQMIDKYESCMGRSALLYYTIALLKLRQCSTSLLQGPDGKALGTDVLLATDALQHAVEYNPHVPQYLLEEKSIVLPPEHTALRGDSEAVAYAFDHIHHWKSLPNALELLECTWENFRRSSNTATGERFEEYPRNMEQTDRRLLPSYHSVSVFPDNGFLTTWLIVSVSIAAISLSLTVAMATHGHLRIDCLANPAHPQCH